MATTPFIWGGNTGEKLTPRQVEQRRVAQALMAREASQTTPVASPFAGINRALQGYLSGREGKALGEAEAAGIAGAQDRVAAALGGGFAQPVRVAGGGTPGAMPATADAAAIRDGLVARGLPPHIAEGFVMNFQDESGLNPGINEAAPLVPGSRGGYGLYQLTGPRRVAYERFAAERGVDPADVDAQLDFLMTELQGPEAAAWERIAATSTPGEAGAAIVESFLRPAPEHRTRRASEYLGAGGTMSPVVSAMAAGPSTMDFAGLMADPWVAQEYGPVISALMGDASGRENAIFQSQLAQADPMYQAQLAALTAPKQPEPISVGGVLLDPTTYEPIFDSRQPGGDGLINAGNGQIYDPNSGQWITAPAGPSQPLSALGKLEADRAAGLISDEAYQAELAGMAPQGMSIESDGAGGFRMVQGAGVSGKPLTEAQSKDTVYATRATGALPIVDSLEQALLSYGEYAAGSLPAGLGNYLQSEDYQVAQNAGREFLASILRKDTGAAVTPSEEALYGNIFLPRPGDKPATLARKRDARALALEAIKAGMPITAIENMTRALGATMGGVETPKMGAATNGAPVIKRYNPATGAFE